MDGTPCIIDDGSCSILWDLSPDGIADIGALGVGDSVDCGAFSIVPGGDGHAHLELDCDEDNAVILCNAAISDNNGISGFGSGIPARFGMGNRNKDEWSFVDLHDNESRMDWIRKYKIVWLSMGLFGIIIVCSVYQIWYCCIKKKKNYIPITITDGVEKYAY